ncbi:hypothetical protein EV426DRAFT_578204 [Tirmania nivea]|nr:hypothetical protein EV426DRAFT_578204 [Tirmania nivea]
MPRISDKKKLRTWFLAGIEEGEEKRRWITLGEALAEAITDALDTGGSEIDAGSSEELSETTSTSELSSSAPPSWIEDKDNRRSLLVGGSRASHTVFPLAKPDLSRSQLTW